jgi:hypothetical protein
VERDEGENRLSPLRRSEVDLLVLNVAEDSAAVRRREEGSAEDGCASEP